MHSVSVMQRGKEARRHGMKTARLVSTLPLCLLASGSLSAQSPAFDGALSARVDSVFGRFAAPGSRGCARGVVWDGRLDCARVYGRGSTVACVAVTTYPVVFVGAD